jgi:hypothetical protein
LGHDSLLRLRRLKLKTWRFQNIHQWGLEWTECVPSTEILIVTDVTKAWFLARKGVRTCPLLYISLFAPKGFSCLLKRNWMLSNQLAQAATLLVCIREVLSSNLGRKTRCLPQYDRTSSRAASYCVWDSFYNLISSTQIIV